MAGFFVLANAQMDVQHIFIAASQQSQGTVGWNLGNRFDKIEIIAEFCAFVFFAFNHGGGQNAFAPNTLAQFGQHRSIFGEAFHQYLLGPFQCGHHIGDTFFLADKSQCFCLRVQTGIGKQAVSQRFQTSFTGDLRLGPAFWLMGKVKVFQQGFTVGG